MCGMSYYLMSFVYEGFRYTWDEVLKCYYNHITKKKLQKPPVGFSANTADWVSMFHEDDDISHVNTEYKG